MRRTINIGWLALVTACLLVAFYTYSHRMSATLAELSAIVDEGNIRLLELQAKNAELEARLKTVGTDAFVEEQARNVYDYMTPNEIRFIITGAGEKVDETEAGIPSP